MSSNSSIPTPPQQLPRVNLAGTLPRLMLAKEEVLKIAKLARLHLTEDEVQIYQKNLTRVLDYISELNKVSTEKDAFVRHVPEDAKGLREDVAERFKANEGLMKNAPEAEDHQFGVPTVVDHE